MFPGLDPVWEQNRGPDESGGVTAWTMVSPFQITWFPCRKFLPTRKTPVYSRLAQTGVSPTVASEQEGSWQMKRRREEQRAVHMEMAFNHSPDNNNNANANEEQAWGHPEPVITANQIPVLPLFSGFLLFPLWGSWWKGEFLLTSWLNYSLL